MNRNQYRPHYLAIGVCTSWYGLLYYTTSLWCTGVNTPGNLLLGVNRARYKPRGTSAVSCSATHNCCFSGGDISLLTPLQEAAVASYRMSAVCSCCLRVARFMRNQFNHGLSLSVKHEGSSGILQCNMLLVPSREDQTDGHTSDHCIEIDLVCCK